MSQVPVTLDQARSQSYPRIWLILLPVAAGAIALLGAQQPLWSGLGILGVLVLYAVGRWPEASTLGVLFIIYSNAAAVAVEFHAVPFIVGSSFFGLLFVPLCFHLFVRRERLIFPSTVVLLVLFSLVKLAGALFAKHPDVAMKELLAFVTEGALSYFLIINVVRTPATLRRAIWTLLVAGFAMSLAPIYQQVSGNFDYNFGGFGQVSDAAFAIEAAPHAGAPLQPRLAGSIGEQNRFAQVMLMLVPLALFRAKGESSGKLRFLAIVATCLITLAVVLTFSRGAAIGIVAVLLAMASLRYIRLRHLAVVVIGLAAVLVVVPQYATRMTKLGGLWAMVDSDNTSNPTMDGSLQSRFTEMGAAVLVFLDYPLIGVGPGMYRFHYREYAEQIGLRVFAKGRGSHSLYLGLAAESGAIGFVLFAAVVFITLRDLMKIHRRFRETRPDYADIAAAFVLAIVAYLTTAMFLHAAYIRFFWLMMALAYAASRLDDDRPAATVSTQVST